MSRNFNPRSPRGGATPRFHTVGRWVRISIHAPHEGERHYTDYRADGLKTISIHAPHEGERLSYSVAYPYTAKFQSTLPTRGSDGMGNGLCSRPAYFNPRSPRGGATRSLKRGITSSVNFNPRSPRGGATVTKPVFDDNDVISIHAPHEGERRMHVSQDWAKALISIHAPHEGERQYDMNKLEFGNKKFQSTLPTRGSDALNTA